jgi:hypothetical protein
MRKNSLLVLLAGAVLLLPAVAFAELGLRSWGPRVAYRLGEDDFDQIVIGAHADMGDVATNTRFKPNIEIGFGSDITAIALNPELHYVFRDDPLGTATFFYMGGGIGLHIFKYDFDDAVEDALGVDVDESETDLKINLAAGVETETSSGIGYFGEVRVSFVDGTFAEFLGGVNFLR